MYFHYLTCKLHEEKLVTAQERNIATRRLRHCIYVTSQQTYIYVFYFFGLFF